MENKILNYQRQILAKKINSYFNISDNKDINFKKEINKNSISIKNSPSCGNCSRKYYGK